MKKNNCYLYTSEIQFTQLMDKTKTIETFGLDHLEEFGFFVTEDLIEEYKKAWDNFLAIEKKIYGIQEAKYNKKD